MKARAQRSRDMEPIDGHRGRSRVRLALALVAAAAVGGSLTACGESAPADSPPAEASTSSSEQRPPPQGAIVGKGDTVTRQDFLDAVDAAGDGAADLPPLCSEASEGKASGAEQLVGESVGTAQDRAEEAGCGFRVVIEDGVGLPVTEDFSPSRINVEVRDGEVIRVDGLY